MYAMSRMARLRRNVGRFLGVLALTGTALFAATTVAAPPAYAAGASNCTFEWILCTAIQYGGQYTPTPLDPNGPGGGNSGSGGYVSSCWLEPNTVWQNPNQDASSPTGFAQYFNDMAAGHTHDLGFQTWIGVVNNIYEFGTVGDPGVKTTNPPYNNGVSGGRWYNIACDPATVKTTDITDIQYAMGVSGAYSQYEFWFWIKDGQTLPKGVQTVTPNMLALFASNHVAVTPLFPAISPDVAKLQTVNLAVKSVNAADANGYGPYTATASLAGFTSSVTAFPVSVTYTTNPSSLMSPTSVTCDFNPDGSIKSPCPTFTFTAPVTAGSADQLIATTTWNVSWTGSTANGAVIWTHPLPGGAIARQRPVTVQEIQTIN